MQSQVTTILTLAVIGFVASQSGVEVELLKKTYSAFKNHKCGKPQMRAMALKDILNDAEMIHPCEAIVPPLAVLSRCDFGSGCCPGSKICKASKKESVTLVFKAYRKVASGANTQCSSTPSGKLWRYLHVTADNHTQCECGRKY